MNRELRRIPRDENYYLITRTLPFCCLVLMVIAARDCVLSLEYFTVEANLWAATSFMVSCICTKIIGICMDMRSRYLSYKD